MNSLANNDASRIPAAINILDVLKGLGHRKLLIAGVTFGAMATGIAVATLIKPVYSSEAQVLIENLESPFDRVQNTETQQAPSGVDERVVISQMAVLKSEDLGRRVVAALKLEDKPEFNPLLKGLGLVSRIKLALGFGDDPRLMSPEQRALGHYLYELAVYQQPESNVISIKYSAADAETAAKVANTLADTYLMTTRESQSRPTERAREWLAQQIEALRGKLAAEEAKVEEFRSGAGLLQGTTTTLGIQEISELNTQISVAQAASAEARTKAEAIRALIKSKESLENSSEVLASTVIERLKEQRAEAARLVGELTATYLPNHPKMVAAKNQLASIDKQIRSEALRIAAGLEDQARVAAAREASLRASLEKLKTQESSANLDSVKLKALERDVAADRVLLETMLSRYAEASSRQDLSSQPGMARIIQSGRVPTSPSFPKPGPMVLLITLAGLSMGLGLAFLLEIMAAAARLTEATQPAAEVPPPVLLEVEPEVPVMAPAPVRQAPQPVAVPVTPPLTLLPRAPAQCDAEQVMMAAGLDAGANAMTAWAAAAQRDFGLSRFAVTSIGGGAGDTSVAAVALARAMATAGERVMVVDLAQSGSWIEELCGVQPGPGITDLITGAADFTKVIGRDARSAAHVLRFGNDHSTHTRNLLEARLESVLGALGRSYNAVIVNAGEARHDTPLLLHKCQAALVLAPPARAAEAADAVRALLAKGLRAARHVSIGQPEAGAAVFDFPVHAAGG